MEDTRRRGPRHRRQWTLGFLMMVIAAAGLACALLKPFAESPPSSDEVIGVGFDMQETRLPDGRVVMGMAPKVSVTKQGGEGSRARRP
jgi:hypothetical protein